MDVFPPAAWTSDGRHRSGRKTEQGLELRIGAPWPACAISPPSPSGASTNLEGDALSGRQVQAMFGAPVEISLADSAHFGSKR
jgi:hypothetical protein